MSEVDKTTVKINNAILDGTGPDGTLKEGDDLREEDLQTLGDYLHCLTKGTNERNAQVISPGLQKFSITSPDGSPASLDSDARGSVNSFSPSSQNSGLSTISNSGFFGADVEQIAPTGKSGHTLLAGDEPNQEILQKVQTALENSRFSPGPNSPFLENGEVNGTIAGEQNKFGSYDPSGKSINLDDLKNTGLALMLKAAGEVNVTTNQVLNGTTAIIPGKAQLAIGRIDPSDLMAKNLDGSPQSQAVTNELATSPNLTLNKSWGTLNTPLEPFDGYMPIGMTIVGTALVLGLKIIMEGFVQLLGVIVKASADKNTPPIHGPFELGQHGKIDASKSLFSLKDIGIVPTERDFVQAVNKGLEVFFDFRGGDFKRIQESPGYYAVFVRTITRSGTQIINEVVDVFKGPFNPLGSAQEFIGLVDVLKSSKIISFLNVLAQMGERALEREAYGFTFFSTRYSQVEHLAGNPATRVMKIHESRNTLRSTYGTSTSPSLFLFPQRSLLASEMIAGSPGGKLDRAISGLSGESKSVILENQKRIPIEILQEIEARLDAEYVPFYFHDLRTNEIISFHAFLSNLEDSYNVNYETTEGYGRIDSVETYRSTDRNISISFTIASTSKEDFDTMWWKVNKLTTLVTPQWSKGRQVISTADQKSFVQPFSQVPTASPVIRMRVGDVIRSNYSKFAITRIFGLGNPDTNIVEQTTSNFTPEYVEDVKKIRRRMTTNPADSGDTQDGFRSGETAYLLPKSHGGYLEATLSFSVPLVPILDSKERKKLILTSLTKVKIERGPAQDPSMKVTYGANEIVYYIVTVIGPAGDSEEMGGKFIVTFNDLIPDKIQIAQAALGKLGTLDPGLATDLPDSSFFNVDQNAITRAFENVGGKGLAGVIKSLSFTEMVASNTSWETTEYGSRAPKMLKCTIQFKVIHDIAPGIDDAGFNRAPQYPVGRVAGNVGGDYESDGNFAFDKAHAEAASTLKGTGKKD